jgi:signal transduction histidine kinase
MPIPLRRPTSISTTPVWMHWLPLWHAVFYVTLVLTTGLALSQEPHPWQHTGGLLVLALGLGLWYGICVVVSPLFWQGRPLVTMGYLSVGWTLWFGLTELNPVYLFVLTGLYPQVFALPAVPGKIVGAFLLTALSAWQQVMVAGGVNGTVLLTLAVAVSGTIMALFISAIVVQSQQRQQLIGELEETRHALAAAERQAGIMQERQRLAREIHDTLAQGFTSVVMHLEAAEAALPAELSTLQRHLEQARRTAREHLAETRDVLWALQPDRGDRVSLGEALTHLATRWAEESNVAAFATVTGTARPMPPEIEVTLLRAAQEALANARKYARASQVALTLSYLDDTVVLDVQDDGVGFDTLRLHISPVSRPDGGFGLKALRERAEQLGGTLSIESAPGQGTTLALTLPALSHESPLSLAMAKEVP